MTYDELVLYAARGFEAAGIIAIALGVLIAVARFLAQRSYHLLRKRIAHSILLGLELLIAADIIATITVRPTLNSVAVLGIIVLIRTFLTFSLEMETTGRWPWQRAESVAQHPQH